MFHDAQFPALPYPGARPDCSFVHEDGVGRVLQHDGHGWRVEHGVTLDEHLFARGVVSTEERHAVLAYGSNACPSKITWLREHLGLRGPVVVLQVLCHGLAAVWAHGFRAVDDQRPATLAAVDGVAERHALWLASDDQLEVLDRCEGRGDRYDLARVRSGRVVLETGKEIEGPLAYVGRCTSRMPLLVDGRMQRCEHTAQHEARHLSGIAAAGDGVVRDVVAAASP